MIILNKEEIKNAFYEGSYRSLCKESLKDYSENKLIYLLVN